MLFKTFHGWQFATTLLEARNSVLLLQIFYSRHKGKTMTRERLTESQPSASSTQSLHWALLESLINSFSSVQFSHVQLFATTWIAARQASLSITNSRSFLKFMSIESVMPSNHFILCRPLLLPPSIFPSSLFQGVSSLHQVAKVLEFQLQHQSFQWTPRTDFL